MTLSELLLFAALEMDYRYYLAAAASYQRLNKIFSAEPIANVEGGVRPAHSDLPLMREIFPKKRICLRAGR